MARVDVGDHHVGQLGAAVGQLDPGHPLAVDGDAPDVDAEPEGDPDPGRRPFQGVPQPAEPSHHVPTAVGLLDVGDARQCCRRTERRRPRVGRVATDQLLKARVVEVSSCRLGERAGAVDPGDVERRTHPRQHRQRRPHRSGEKGALADRPQPGGVFGEACPLGARAGAEGLERGREGGRIIGHVEGRAVRPAVPDLRVEPHEFELVGERGARQPEQLVEDVRQREQGRTELERVAAFLQRGELAADHRIALDQLDLVPSGCQPDGGCQPPDPRSDDDRLHARRPSRRATAVAATGSMPTAPTAATTRSPKKVANPTVSIVAITA